jgi:hypothetical protein
LTLFGPVCEEVAVKAWQHKRSKIRPELTFPLTHAMPL